MFHMRLRQYLNTPGSKFVFFFLFINIGSLVLRLVLFLIEEFHADISIIVYFVIILGIILALLTPLVPALVDLNKTFVTSLAIASGGCSIILCILSLIPFFDLGDGFDIFAIINLVSGFLVIIPSIVAQFKEERKA